VGQSTPSCLSGADLPELKLFPDGKPRKGGGTIRTHEDSKPSTKGSTSLDDALKEPHPPDAKVLIQELRSEVPASYQDTESGGRICVPEHSIGVNEGEEGKREVCVKVALPGVSAAKEVELEVSEVSE
jgi:hypothetical protein